MKIRISLDEADVKLLLKNKSSELRPVIGEIARQYLMKKVNDFSKGGEVKCQQKLKD
jgi:hypothetical protein